LGRIPFGQLGKTLPVPELQVPSVHITKIYDKLLSRQPEDNRSNIKILYVVASNLLNQFLNTNKGVAALQNVEFIVVHDIFMTPTARYADIILPVSSSLEREDIARVGSGGQYYIHMEKAIEPLPDTKSDLDIFTELASLMGISGFNNKTEEDWVREFAAATPALPDFEKFKNEGVHIVPFERPWVAFKEQVENSGNKRFQTPSGKIEIYSQKLADMHNPLLPPIPKYIPAWDGVKDPLKDKYPIQLVSSHSRARVNSSLFTIPDLKALADDSLWLNENDAAARGIEDGDKVRVFNDRGQLLAKVRITTEIMPGVVSLDAGRWFDPGKNGIDTGGCLNVLTRDEASPAGAFTCNSCLVQIEKEPL
jgi:anaerobic dimethyl sulfoxide reductase subunit A